MISLFEIPSTDASVSGLSIIFGTMNGLLPPAAGATTTISLLGTMFKTFNGIALTIGVLIVVYVTILGVLETAQEGEFMGKKYHKLWTPIRTVIGIAALVPTGSGYCALQIVMMWVILQGIGAADKIWSTVLGYVNVVGSPYAQVSIPTVGAASKMQTLFKALVCDAAARETNKDPTNTQGGSYYCSTGGGFCTGQLQALSTTASTYAIGPGGNCGTLTYCNSAQYTDKTTLASMSCSAQITALSAIIPTLAGIAAKFQATDYAYRDFYANSYNNINNSNWKFVYDYCAAQNPPIPKNECCVPTENPLYKGTQVCRATKKTFPSPNTSDGSPQSPSDTAVTTIYWPYAIAPAIGTDDFISTAVNFYTNALSTAVTNYIQTQSQNNELKANLAAAQATGWIYAGSYYYLISGMNNKVLADAVPTLDMSTVDPSTSTSNTMSNYRNNYAAASALLSAASKAASEGGAFSQQFSGVGTVVASSNSSVGSALSTLQVSDSNPLMQLQNIGMVMLVIVQSFFVALLAITIVMGLSGSISVWAAGFGFFNPGTPTAMLVYFILAPALFALISMMVSIGALLGVYLPLIPYVIFTFGAIGWFLSTIEAMVAGPLVALGILIPGGHELLGRAESALMLIFNIFLRPSLMVFGLIAGMLLATVVVQMINTAYWSTVVMGISGSPDARLFKIWLGTHFLQTMIFFIAYVFLIVSALNKCFAAIHIIPERVMTWIGGQGISYGEEEAVGAMRGGVMQAAGGARGAVGHVAGAPKGVAGRHKEAKKEKEEEAARKKIQLGGGGTPPKGGGT